ncbi:aldehyde dehydrogenase domain-containing protein [Hygrophoropsis aurantiaca]|uniref:Aldehyde dehydrogenase domain-containing protein n=1 Tax=Hygrophoropsis aurantiaca TaxID=72124 RepID=A0ACB7ZZ28_9AGAM|nr:aldehyde dehydrogenase domain-containing protein [Hygrophoropsis aurantiaca]
MPSTFTHKFDAVFKGTVSFNTGIYINGEFTDGSDKTEIDVINPSTGQLLTRIAEATAADVDRAVVAAQAAFDTTWGLNCPGSKRSILMTRLAELMAEHADELAALEALDNGKTFTWARNADVAASIDCIRYYAGWADKITGQTIETDESKLAYTRHEPIGVVGQIIPWNFPLLMLSWKLGPALATGNVIVLKPSEFTPLTAIRVAHLAQEAGFPKGVINILTGYGNTVGNAISSHMHIEKVAFTGSTLVGRKIMEAAAKSNLKNVTLELGGKSPNIIFDDADLDLAVAWAAHGIFWNHGQTCCAGSRIFVHENIYDEFLKRFTEKTRSLKVGDPFASDTFQGPQVSEIQYNRIMSYIESGISEGATCLTGGARHGQSGYFIQPTIFTDTTPSMRIVREEIFGPVGVVIPFTTGPSASNPLAPSSHRQSIEEVVKQANDTEYGLAAAVFTKDLNRAIHTAHALKAGTAWVNCVNSLDSRVPFGGFKTSGIGRELGEYALANYTAVKAVHINLSAPVPQI